MFIADFIKALAQKNASLKTVSISCFTATAKQEVADEIQKYFKDHFNKDLKLFRSTTKRQNLTYKTYKIGEEGASQEEIEHLKFTKLIDLLKNEVKHQPCIIFTRYTGENAKI